jgi:hypothetical protein
LKEEKINKEKFIGTDISDQEKIMVQQEKKGKE